MILPWAILEHLRRKKQQKTEQQKQTGKGRIDK